MTHHEKYRHVIDWNGITLEITHEPCWLNTTDIYGTPLAHIQAQSIAPERAALPITKTGYLSHFCGNAEIIEAGGAINYIRAWLDDAARLPAWKQAQDEARQFSLL